MSKEKAKAVSGTVLLLTVFLPYGHNDIERSPLLCIYEAHRIYTVYTKIWLVNRKNGIF